jgi:hypothetical protein
VEQYAIDFAYPPSRETEIAISSLGPFAISASIQIHLIRRRASFETAPARTLGKTLRVKRHLEFGARGFPGSYVGSPGVMWVPRELYSSKILLIELLSGSKRGVLGAIREQFFHILHMVFAHLPHAGLLAAFRYLEHES